MSAGRVTAYAPASVGNVAVGFDLLGHALEGAGDRVTVRLGEQSGIRITRVSGLLDDLPRETHRNTAAQAVQALLTYLQSTQGLDIEIEKGIPLGSGLGGSAASAVAAVLAAAQLLETGLEPAGLYPFALAGEAVASGTAHGDNVGPQLIGGLVLATHSKLVPVPVPTGLTAVVVHPQFMVETRTARQALQEPYQINEFVSQSSNLALVIAGCFRNDFSLIRAGLKDLLVEPRRAHLIPGFRQVKQAALDHGALGASISGAGPTVFGWFEEPGPAAAAGESMRAAFAEAGLQARALVSAVDAPGARIEA